MHPDVIATPGPPATYLGVADEMVRGVRVLADAPTSPAVAFSLLSAHALECFLKAWLSRDGNDRRLRRQALRHNLSALWALCVAEGLEVPNPVPDWVARLSEIHVGPKYHLRYSTGINGIVTPGTSETLRGLQNVQRAVHAQLRK